MKNALRHTLAALLWLLLLCACGNDQRSTVRHARLLPANDSLLNALKAAEDNRYFDVIDSLEQHNGISEARANYLRADFYYSTDKLRAAEFYYTKALSDERLQREAPFLFYQACVCLSTVLYNKLDMDNSIKVATKGYAIARNDTTLAIRSISNRLLAQIGSCQLRLNRYKEASETFMQAYANMQELADKTNNFSMLNAWAITANNILTDYSECDSVSEAIPWIERAETAVARMVASPDCPPDLADKMQARITCSKAIVLAKQGKPAEADAAYDDLLLSMFAHTDDGIIDRIVYLQTAKRWKELLALAPLLDSLDREWETPLNLEYLTGTLGMYFTANMETGHTQEALSMARRIVSSLDTISRNMLLEDANQLAVIYETQEKEAKIAEQAASMNRQLAAGVSGVLLLIVVFLVVLMVLRHRAAVRLEEKNRQLEEKNRQLTVANDRAEESSRMKTDFIRQISHEIRTPLNVLSGFTQIVTTPDMHLDNATKHDINQKITENTERITSLVNKMLELSDASSQTVIECADEVLAVQIAAQAAEDARITQASHIAFSLVPEEGVDTLMLKTNLRNATRALTLLLDNALKFTKEGSVWLHVVKNVALPTQQTGHMAFIVEDTGVGVPASEAEHIFEEFVQLDEYYDGTGIGLTVARSIAQRLGGDIVLDTSYSGGARFIMTLPISL